MPARSRRAGGATLLLKLLRIEGLALQVAVHRGRAAIRAGLRLDGYVEPVVVTIDAAVAKLEAELRSDGGDVAVSMTPDEAAQLEIAADTGLAVIKSQGLIPNTYPTERAVEKLKGLA